MEPHYLRLGISVSVEMKGTPMLQGPGPSPSHRGNLIWPSKELSEEILLENSCLRKGLIGSTGTMDVDAVINKMSSN